MLSSQSQKLSVEQIKKLLGPPLLIRGESEEDYWNWWDAFVAQYEPESLTDWLDVDQLATKHWEQERLKRSNTALLDSVMCKALASLLADYTTTATVTEHAKEPLSFIDHFRLAKDYYSGEGDAQEFAGRIVEEFGITDDQIIAKAMQLRGDAMIQFDRMDNYRTTAKRALLKRLDQRSPRFTFSEVSV
jgi:hypothetical protein